MHGHENGANKNKAGLSIGNLNFNFFARGICRLTFNFIRYIANFKQQTVELWW